MALFIPISKVDAAQRLVYGVLSEEVRDKSDEILDYATAKPAFEKWSNEIKEATGGKSLGNVRAMHSSIAAGKFTNINYDDDAKRIEGCAKIVDDNEWNKVVEGVYTGFSIGGGYARRWPDPDNSGVMRYTPTLAEVSIVDNPCVPTATFEYIKADGSVEMRKFTLSPKEDSMDPKVLAAAREALAKGTATDEQKAFIATADAELLKAAQDADTAGTATDERKTLLAKVAADAEAAKVPLVKDGKPVKPKAEPQMRWLSKRALEVLEREGALDEACEKKDDARVRNLILEKQAELAPGLAEMDALLKGAKPKEDEDEDAEGDDEETKKTKKARRDEKAAKAKAEKDDAEMAAKAAAAAELAKQKEIADKAAADALGKKDYSEKERKEMADKKQALPDGSFPIANKKDLENAIQAYGRAKDKTEAKAHIMARAKALGAEDLLPKDWTGKKDDKKEKAAPASDLQKGLHQVGWLACLLQDLQRLQESVVIEQYFEDDKDSELPAKLKSLVSEMCELLVTLVEEETEELTEGDDDDVEILEMAAGLPTGHPGAIAKAVRTKAEPLSKSDSKTESALGEKLVKFAEVLEKAGARHSKADAERVQALQDHADDVRKCMGEMAEKCADMHKAAGKAKNTAIDLGAKGERADDEDDAGPANKDAVKMLKMLEALTSEKVEKSALTEVVGKMDNTLSEAVSVMKTQTANITKLENEKSELAKRVAHLEGQPAPAKGNLRAVSKTQDSGGTGDGKTQAEFEAELAKMTPEDRTIALIKIAQKNPVSA